MREYVIERVDSDGIVRKVAAFESEQRLFNDIDLSVIAEEKGLDIRFVIIREKYDTSNAYYYGDGWSFNQIDNILNTIKRRL